MLVIRIAAGVQRRLRVVDAVGALQVEAILGAGRERITRGRGVRAEEDGMQHRRVRRVVPAEFIDVRVLSNFQFQAGGTGGDCPLKSETQIRRAAAVGDRVEGVAPERQRTGCARQRGRRRINEEEADVLIAAVNGSVVPIRLAVLIEIGTGQTLERRAGRSADCIGKSGHRRKERYYNDTAPSDLFDIHTSPFY